MPRGRRKDSTVITAGVILLLLLVGSVYGAVLEIVRGPDRVVQRQIHGAVQATLTALPPPAASPRATSVWEPVELGTPLPTRPPTGTPTSPATATLASRTPLAAATSAAAPTGTPTIRTVTALATVKRNANGRAGPGTNYQVIATFKTGDKVIAAAIDSTGTWYQLATGPWVFGELLDISRPAGMRVAAATPMPCYVQAEGYLSVLRELVMALYAEGPDTAYVSRVQGIHTRLDATAVPSCASRFKAHATAFVDDLVATLLAVQAGAPDASARTQALQPASRQLGEQWANLILDGASPAELPARIRDAEALAAVLAPPAARPAAQPSPVSRPVNAPPPASPAPLPGYVGVPFRPNATTNQDIYIYECFGAGDTALRFVTANTPIQVLGSGSFAPPPDTADTLGSGPFAKCRIWDGQYAWIPVQAVRVDAASLPAVSGRCEEYDRIDWANVVRPTPTSPPQRFYTAPEPDRRGCCKVCTSGKACGDTCIARNKTCHVGGGCACDG